MVYTTDLLELLGVQGDRVAHAEDDGVDRALVDRVREERAEGRQRQRLTGAHDQRRRVDAADEGRAAVVGDDGEVIASAHAARHRPGLEPALHPEVLAVGGAEPGDRADDRAAGGGEQPQAIVALAIEGSLDLHPPLSEPLQERRPDVEVQEAEEYAGEHDQGHDGPAATHAHPAGDELHEPRERREEQASAEEPNPKPQAPLHLAEYLAAAFDEPAPLHLGRAGHPLRAVDDAPRREAQAVPLEALLEATANEETLGAGGAGATTHRPMIRFSRMSRFLMLCGVLIVTFLGFFLFPTPNDGKSAEEVLGMPVVCLGTEDASEPCWLTLGAGEGVVVVGIGGFGLVAFTFYGVGLLLGTGQLAAGGITIAQVGFGGSFLLGQAGVAPVALGQVVGGALVKGQGQFGADGGEMMKNLSKEVNALLGPSRN